MEGTDLMAAVFDGPHCATQPGNASLPVLSLIVAALAVIVGPYITLRISRKQIELSRRIASKQIVAPMRQVWINELRSKVAELSSSALYYWNTKFDEQADEKTRRVWQLEEEIKLLINPGEDDHKALINAIRQLLSAMEKGVGATGAAEEFSAARHNTSILSQKIFKTEWDRIKNDIEKP
jgi:Icc-related predicted phosphoesterase